MQRLIDANELLKDKVSNAYISRFEIENAPTIDAEPVVHAHWEDDGHGYYMCSHCEDYIITDEDGNPPSFLKSDWVLNIHRCPHCDAKMDEEAEQE